MAGAATSVKSLGFLPWVLGSIEGTSTGRTGPDLSFRKSPWSGSGGGSREGNDFGAARRPEKQEPRVEVWAWGGPGLGQADCRRWGIWGKPGAGRGPEALFLILPTTHTHTQLLTRDLVQHHVQAAAERGVETHSHRDWHMAECLGQAAAVDVILCQDVWWLGVGTESGPLARHHPPPICPPWPPLSAPPWHPVPRGLTSNPTVEVSVAISGPHLQGELCPFGCHQAEAGRPESPQPHTRG